MFFRFALTCICSLWLSSAIAAEYRQGSLRISQIHARATAPGQSSAAVYLTVENSGKDADELLSVQSSAATTANLHSMSMTGNVMKMREIERIAIAPASTLAMRAGHGHGHGDGHHIMLTGLSSPLVAGQTIPLVLTFKKAGVIKTTVSINPLTATH